MDICSSPRSLLLENNKNDIWILATRTCGYYNYNLHQHSGYHPNKLHSLLSDQVKDLVKAEKLTIVETITSTKVNWWEFKKYFLSEIKTVGRGAKQETGQEGAGRDKDISFHSGELPQKIPIHHFDLMYPCRIYISIFESLHILSILNISGAGEHLGRGKQERLGAERGRSCCRVHTAEVDLASFCLLSCLSFYHVVGVKTKMICHDTQPDFLCSVVQTWTSVGWWPLGTWATVRLLPQRSDFRWFLHCLQWYSLWWRRWYNCTINNVKGRQSRLSNSGGDKRSCCCCLGQGWPCFVEFKYVKGSYINYVITFGSPERPPPPCNTLIIWG